jgi:hypothetical protein
MTIDASSETADGMTQNQGHVHAKPVMGFLIVAAASVSCLLWLYDWWTSGRLVWNGLGVRPSNHCGSHDALSCALTMPVIVALGDGRVGVSRGPEPAGRLPPLVRRRGDTA